MNIGTFALRSTHSFVNRLNFGFSIFVDTDCNWRGQTSCPVGGVDIQTGCYSEANPLDHYHLLGAACWVCNSEALLELLYNRRYTYTTVSSNLNLLSCKDIPHPPSSSKPSTRPCSRTQPNKSAEPSAIQKGSINWAVAAAYVNGLLSTTSNVGKFDH